MSFRLYTFVNHLYMSPLQWGIQTAHVVSTMSVRYKRNTEQHKAYVDWATNDPTVIVCQGGNVKTLMDLAEVLETLANELNLGFAKFHEDEQSLGGVITCVGVLVPDSLFDVYLEEFEVLDIGKSPVFRHPTSNRRFAYGENPIEFDFLKLVKLAKLA